MKITALQSSTRRGGNTEHIVRLLEESLRRQAALLGEPFEFDYIAQAERSIGTCRGCRVCFDKGEGKCPLKDELPDR